MLDLANKVLFTSEMEDQPAVFRQTLSFLNNYIIYHFAAEEAAMAQFRYPGARYHTEFHDGLRWRSGEIITQATSEGVSEEVKEESYLLIEDWLIYHTLQTDRELAVFLQERARGGGIVHLPDIKALKSSGLLPMDFDEAVASGMTV